MPQPTSRLSWRKGLVLAAVLCLAAAPGAAEERKPPLLIAQSQDTAQLFLRIQQLEEQVRNLTGQVEGLQFQLTELHTLIERMTEDNEFRFQQLEGGAAGKPEAATQSGGDMPAGASPQTEEGANPPTEGQPTGPDGEPLSPEDIVIDPTFDAPAEELGNSRDPLIGDPDANGMATLGSIPETDLDSIEAAGRLDVGLGAGEGTPSGDADAQYAAGYEAVLKGDYAFAESQFSQFVALYPDDPRAADATNWLGESLIQLGSYDQAAEVLLTGFQQFPQSERAPDMLLKLGVALAGAGEQETACRTFAEVQKRYTNLSPAFQNRLFDEARRAQCQG